MEPANVLSDTPSKTLFFLLAFGIFISSNPRRNSDAMPSDMSFAFSRACAALVKGAKETT